MIRKLASVAIALACGLVPLAVFAADDDAQPAPAPSSSASGKTSAAPSASGSNLPIKLKGKGPAEAEENPLVVPEGLKDVVGSSYATEDRPVGDRVRSGLWPIAYKERISNEITTAVFPFYYDRRLLDSAGKKVEQQSFYGLYYRRRSEKVDVDAAFPLYFRWRDDQTTTTVIPPVLWRSAPDGEWHRWVAPLFFASSQPDGGYFHAPLLLTFSHHNAKRAFSLIGGLGFYDRTERDIDWGIVPFVFGGSNADKLTSYTLIPPLLTYHSANKDLGNQTTLVGPVLYKTTPKSMVLDVFPLFLHNHGEDYNATTLLPLFHKSQNKDKSLFITPLFGSASDKDGSLVITPVYTRYRGRTELDLAGPIIPLFAHYRDKDVYKDSWLIGPVYTSNDPTGYSLITPLFGQWREYGVSRTTWIFPTIVHSTVVDGWSLNVHPLFYFGRDGESTHSVVAPFWWDFASPKKRTTIGFPIFWRFRDEEGITQVALNTVYLERPSSKGPNWDFYFAPLFHVGDYPNGSAWDVLFGLVGYKKVGTYKQLKVFWFPIDLTPDPNASKK